MKPLKIILIVCFSLISLITLAFSDEQKQEDLIKIGILEKAKSFNLSCEGDYNIYELSSGLKENIKPMDDFPVKCEGTTLIIGMMRYSAPVRLVPESSGEKIRINGRRYRDRVFITAKDGLMTVINETGLEEYLYGVLPREVDPGWKLEALKAQAVVSRTFTLKNLRKHENDGFNVCDSVHCQVYGGVECEQEQTTLAVEETRGLVLTFEDNLANGLFSACCGGKTESPAGVWNWDAAVPKYLAPKACKYCKESPHYKWTKKVSEESIRKALIKNGFSTGKITKLEKESRSKSGRTRVFRIKHAKGSFSIQGNKLRLVAGPESIRSLMIDSISKKGSSFVFKGRGWGHGVGMCQWGAKVMAEKGHDYKEILKYYFPGTKIKGSGLDM